MLVRLIAQSHLDPSFMWPWEEGLAETLATCQAAVDKLGKYKDLIFVKADVFSYQWIAQTCPALLEQIRQYVKTGQWIPIGGWYIQAAGSGPDGESFIRQALVGQKILKDLFNLQSPVAYLVDSCGLPATLPKILAQCGYKYFVFSRPGANRLELPSPLFRWIADDGSDILSYRIPVSYCTYAEEVERIKEVVDLTPPWLDQTMCFFGMGNHGGGPTERQIERVIRFASEPNSPEIVFSHPQRFFETVKNNPNIPSYRGPLERFIVGCYATAVSLKQLHDQAQQELLLAEQFSSLAAGANLEEYGVDALNNAWEKLLFGQFHDFLPGTCVRESLEDIQHVLGGVLAEARRIKTFALRKIVGRLDTRAPGFIRFAVINQTRLAAATYAEYEPWLFWQPWENYRLVDEQDQPVPHQQTQSEPAAPGHTRLIIKLDPGPSGFRLLRVVGPEPDFSTIGPNVKTFALDPQPVHQVVSPRYQMDFGSTHHEPVRLIDRKTGTDLGGRGLFDAVVMDDPTDTFTFHDVGFDRCAGTFQNEPPRLLETGPLRWSVELRRQYRRSSLRQELRFFDEDDAIELHTWLNWQEPRHLLKLVISLPFAPLRLTRGQAFGQAPCPAENEEFPFQQWLRAEPVEPGTGALKGMAVLVGPGLHSADFVNHQIRLTLIRSPIYCHEELNRPYLPGPRHQAMELGEHYFKITLLPLYRPVDPGYLVERANALACPSAVVTTHAHDGASWDSVPALRVEPATTIVTALKLAQDRRGYIVRLWETAGQVTRGRLHCFSREFPFEIPAHGLRTLRLMPGDPWRVEPVNGLEEPMA